jgi:hypothetical protein
MRDSIDAASASGQGITYDESIAVAAYPQTAQDLKVERKFVQWINTFSPHMERRPERRVFMNHGLRYHSYRLPRQRLA